MKQVYSPKEPAQTDVNNSSLQGCVKKNTEHLQCYAGKETLLFNIKLRFEPFTMEGAALTKKKVAQPNDPGARA